MKIKKILVLIIVSILFSSVCVAKIVHCPNYVTCKTNNFMGCVADINEGNWYPIAGVVIPGEYYLVSGLGSDGVPNLAECDYRPKINFWSYGVNFIARDVLYPTHQIPGQLWQPLPHSPLWACFNGSFFSPEICTFTTIKP